MRFSENVVALGKTGGQKKINGFLQTTEECMIFKYKSHDICTVKRYVYLDFFFQTNIMTKILAKFCKAGAKSTGGLWFRPSGRNA